MIRSDQKRTLSTKSKRQQSTQDHLRKQQHRRRQEQIVQDNHWKNELTQLQTQAEQVQAELFITQQTERNLLNSLEKALHFETSDKLKNINHT